MLKKGDKVVLINDVPSLDHRGLTYREGAEGVVVNDGFGPNNEMYVVQLLAYGQSIVVFASNNLRKVSDELAELRSQLAATRANMERMREELAAVRALSMERKATIDAVRAALGE
jgi:hypothetical protein